MQRQNALRILLLAAILFVGNAGFLALPLLPNQNGGAEPRTPSTGDSGNLVRNPYFEGSWQNDWVTSEVSTSVSKQQSVHTYAVHHPLSWFTCKNEVDESFDSAVTARDDGSLSFAEGISLTKVGSGTSAVLRAQARLMSSGYAYAHASGSDLVCSDSHAEVSWSIKDTVTYVRRITQSLSSYNNDELLTYAVFSAKYKMLSTMTGSEVWHAKITFILKAPDGATKQVMTEYFESQALNGVERAFNEDVRDFMRDHGKGVYQYIIEFEISLHHEDSRSDSDDGKSGATATTPSITMDDYVSLDVYGLKLMWTTTYSPVEVAPINPNPDTDGQVTLSWSRSYKAPKYYIYREATPISDVSTLTKVAEVLGENTTTWTDPSAPRGMNYYVVIATDGGLSSSPISNCEGVEVILKPPAPTGLAADIYSVPAGKDDDGLFNLTWNAATQAVSYKVFMSLSEITSIAGMTPIATVTTTKALVGPFVDGTYYFVVVGSNLAGDGAVPNNISVVVEVKNPPVAPVWVTAGPITTYNPRVDLSWEPSLGAWNYTVYRNSTPILNTRLTTFTDYNLEDGKIYNYTVTGWNYKGEGAHSVDCLVNCTIPDVFDKVAEWMNSLDPMLYNIIFKALDAILGAVGGPDVIEFLSGHGDTATVDFTLNVGDYEITAGVKLKLDFRIVVTLSRNPDTVRIVIAPKTTTSFNLAGMGFDTPFGEIGQVMGELQAFGVTITPTLYVAGKIDFQIVLSTGDVMVNEIAIQFKPVVTATLNVLKCILQAAAPEAEPVVSAIAAIIDKLTGFDIYDILTSQLTITLDVIIKYFPTTGKVVLDIIVDVKFDAIRINFVQPKKGDHYEIVAGMYGQCGVHWETGASLTWCGQLYFYLAFDFQDVKISLVRNFLENVVEDIGLRHDEVNKKYLFGPETACAPISLGAGLRTGGGVDSDNDYLTDAEEVTYGTNALMPDSDGDGLWDYVEILEESNPNSVDTDGDGLLDAEEYDLGTDLSAVDTDGDGLNDYVEVKQLGTDPNSVDTDNDLLWDGDEITAGTDPKVADCDQDGFLDGWEVNWYETDPLSAASVPADPDRDGLPSKDESNLYQTSPYYNDVEDSDGDMLPNAAETIFYGTDPKDADTDDDDLNDNIEIENGIYYLDPDSDDDRLLDGEEFLVYGTDPLNPDTDGDGYTDYLEIMMGSNPLSRSSIPVPAAANNWAEVWMFFIGCGLTSGSIFTVWAFKRYFGNPLRGLKLGVEPKMPKQRAVKKVKEKIAQKSKERTEKKVKALRL